MVEIWKEIYFLEGVPNKYYASNMGRIKNKDGKIMKYTNDKDGYAKICFYILTEGKKKYYKHCRVARIIAKLFIGEIPDNYCVHHINGIRDDNRVSNLKLMTMKEINYKNNKKFIDNVNQ